MDVESSIVWLADVSGSCLVPNISGDLSEDTMHFALCGLMDSTIWFDIIHLGWLTVHIKGSQVRISNYHCLRGAIF